MTLGTMSVSSGSRRTAAEASLLLPPHGKYYSLLFCSAANVRLRKKFAMCKRGCESPIQDIFHALKVIIFIQAIKEAT